MTRVVAIVVFLAAVVCPSCSLAEGGAEQFCQPRLIRDYEAPLRDMPAIRHVPRLGTSIKGLGGFRLSASPRVLSSSDRIGFEAESPVTQANWWPGWTVSGTLWRVTKYGKTISSSQRRKIYFTETKPRAHRELSFKVSGAAGFYRVDVTFKNVITRQVVAYAEYFRVVRPDVNVRLKVNQPAYHVGETAQVRLENPGSTLIGFGELFFVEHYSGSSWIRVPELTGPPGAILLVLDRGRTSRCQHFPVIDSLSPGTYRVRKDVSVFPYGARHIDALAQFDVLP